MKLKKLVISVFILFYFKPAVCQSTNAFKQYSYLIIKYRNFTPIEWATCFFTKSKGKLFLITAYHFFADVNVFDSVRINHQWNRLVVKMNGADCYEIKLNMDSIKKVSPIITFYNKPDIFILPITDMPKQIKLNSIEEYIKKYSKNNGMPDSVFLYGFMKPDTGFYNTKRLMNLVSTFHKGALLNFNQGITHTAYKVINDTINMITYPTVFEGMSGSPVFFLFKKTNTVTFGGLAFGGVLPQPGKSNYGYIVRPESIIKSLISK